LFLDNSKSLGAAKTPEKSILAKKTALQGQKCGFEKNLEYLLA
jgi:hypothetical protein